MKESAKGRFFENLLVSFSLIQKKNSYDTYHIYVLLFQNFTFLPLPAALDNYVPTIYTDTLVQYSLPM